VQVFIGNTGRRALKVRISGDVSVVTVFLEPCFLLKTFVTYNVKVKHCLRHWNARLA
jgi:hypothetical protein